jgi:uncharacterized C2H2 Zn-finger protein
MADGSQYYECDRCGAVFDKRPEGGTYRYFNLTDLQRDAKAAGWVISDDPHGLDLCRNCKGEPPEPE